MLCRRICGRGKKTSRRGWKWILSLRSQTSWIIYKYTLFFHQDAKLSTCTEGHVGRLVGTGVAVQTPVVGLDGVNKALFWGRNRRHLKTNILLQWIYWITMVNGKQTFSPHCSSASWPSQAMAVCLSVETPEGSWGRRPGRESARCLMLCHGQIYRETSSDTGRLLKSCWARPCCTQTSLCRAWAACSPAGYRSCRQKHLDITTSQVESPWRQHNETYTDFDQLKNWGCKQSAFWLLAWRPLREPTRLALVATMLISCPGAKDATSKFK